jgi:hypothetical protein
MRAWPISPRVKVVRLTDNGIGLFSALRTLAPVHTSSATGHCGTLLPFPAEWQQIIAMAFLAGVPTVRGKKATLSQCLIGAASADGGFWDAAWPGSVN